MGSFSLGSSADSFSPSLRRDGLLVFAQTVGKWPSSKGHWGGIQLLIDPEEEAARCRSGTALCARFQTEGQWVSKLLPQLCICSPPEEGLQMSHPRRWIQHLSFTPAQSTDATNSSFKITTGRGGCPYYNLMFITVMFARKRAAFGCLSTMGRFNPMSGSPVTKP